MLTEAIRARQGRYLTPGWNGHALDRFLRNCEHDPATGCVLWAGGTTAGRGHHARYGAFWYEGERWAAHRWAAAHIHGHDINGYQVDHCCPLWRHGGPDPLAPNTLCVDHVRPLTSGENRDLQAARGQMLTQGVLDRKYWVYVQVGLLEAPQEYEPPAMGVPFYLPPAWLAGGASSVERAA